MIIMKKNEFFGYDLENIDKNEIFLTINKLKKNFPYINLETSECECGSLDDDLLAHKSPTLNSLKIQSKIRYPLYINGSFKEDIDKFLDENINHALKKVFNKIDLEIKKVYKGYITIENILYEKIIGLINFSETKEEFSKLQIISRIKEISEILEQTFHFIKYYLFHNFALLKSILEYLDINLVKLYGVKSVSLIFLLKYFELPNNELSYILMFKIFDEETLILDYILNGLKNQINGNNNLLINNIVGTESESRNDNSRDSKLFNDEDEEDKNETLNAMLDLMDTYINKAKRMSEKINNIDSYRALYNNYFMYLRGNYNLDPKNKLLNFSLITEDSNSINNESILSELISINSLMDEEVTIKYFLNKKIMEDFLLFFKKNLSIKYKINKALIIIYCIQFYAIIPFIIFMNRDKNFFEKIFLYLISYNIGNLINKLLCTFLIYKNFSLKIILLVNNFFLIISILFIVFKKLNFLDDLDNLLIIIRFLYGLSNSKLVFSKFLVSFEPKLILIQSIKFFFRLKYLSIFIAILFISIIKHIFNNDNYSIIDNDNNYNVSASNNNNNDTNTDNYFNIDLINKNINELIFLFFSLLIMIINIIFFRNIRIRDVDIKKKETVENILINDNNKTESNNFIRRSNLIESTNSDLSKISDDHHSNLSFGKRKLISYRNRRKAKLLDKHFKSYSNNENYEGTNQIFEEIDQIILNQNKCNSYINKISFGLLFIIVFLNINNDLLMLLVTYMNNSKYILYLFAFPYLIGYLSFYFKKQFLKKFNNNINIINFINKIISIIIYLDIIIYFIMLLSLLISDYKQQFNNINYIIIGCSIIIAFLNIIIETFVTIIMSITIPIEKTFCKINIGNYIDLTIILFKSISFLFIYLMNNFLLDKNRLFNDNKIYNKSTLLILISMLYSILAFIFFYFFNYNINYNSLTRIMNKISYEKQ